VSRTTVREAIRVLEGEGSVTSRRGASGGIIVLDQAQDEERIRPLLAGPALGAAPAVSGRSR
jgi:DNA-binding FadR family transcriptional regulator